MGRKLDMKNNTSLGAILTVVAMLGFASMVVRKRGFAKAVRSQRPILQAVRALIAVVESAVFVLAFRYLPLADTHALAATSPLIVIALGALLLGEKVDRTRWLAVAAGFAGVLLIVRP